MTVNQFTVINKFNYKAIFALYRYNKKDYYMKVTDMQKYIVILCATITVFAMATTSFAVSTAVKAQNDYFLTLSLLRQIRIMVENFGDETTKNKYQEIQTLFQSASEEYYGQQFDSSHQKYYKVKQELVTLTDALATLYINRAQQILDSTSKQSFDIMIKYDKNSTLKKYFQKPYNPVEEIKPYNPEEYHLFFDRETIERYLKNGYRKLQEAKNMYNNQDIVYLKTKNNIKHDELEFIIKQYLAVIDFCRLAKQYGIEIHKMVKVNQLDTIQRKYGLESNKLDPIYDDRIPEEFKVDANDNISLVHSIEKARLEKKLK